jgi:hypothetical protein
MSAARNQRIRAEKKIKNLISKLTPEQAKELETKLEEQQNGKA